MKTAWFYQMSSRAGYSPEDFRQDIEEDNEVKWPTRKLTSPNGKRPEKGDTVFFFFADQKTTDRGLYGWGVILSDENNSKEIRFIPKNPTDKLKKQPIRDDKIERSAANIRGNSPRGTMWEVFDKSDERLLKAKILGFKTLIVKNKVLSKGKANGKRLPKGKRSGTGYLKRKGQGIITSKEIRKLIENFAMKKAKHYFHKKGYAIQDVSAHEPFDLRGNVNNKEIYIEVKGTQSLGKEVFLTPNEVKYARKNKKRMVLFVVHSIKIVEKSGGSIAVGGNHLILQPWNVDIGDLGPLGYAYRLLQIS